MDVVELRSIDSGNNVFQVLVVATEPEAGESGEDNGSERRWMSVFSVILRPRGSEFKIKSFEACQSGQGSDHSLG